MGLSNVYGLLGLRRLEQRPLILDGVRAARGLKRSVASSVERSAAAGAPRPVLATILVGDDPASATYVAAKHRACEEVGISSIHIGFGTGTAGVEIAGRIHELNEDASVSGVLLQLPVPPGIDAARLIGEIDPAKDVDGLTIVNQGRLAAGFASLVPCTPSGILSLLDRNGIDVEGRRVAVVGRSRLVGSPLAVLLTQRNATVTLCHSRTPDLSEVTRSADLLIAAAGIPALIGAEHVGPESVVIDVGIHRTPQGLTGDVDRDAIGSRVAAISPVPGGVGPMTVAALLENTAIAAGAMDSPAVP